MRLPTKLDRYPAKMVSRLADRLIDRYASGANRLLDPFCGSGAILTAAHLRRIEVSGVDINPLALLFCRVKVAGFRPDIAREIASELISDARSIVRPHGINWAAKHYWFTPGVLLKYERLRAASASRNLLACPEGVAVLLAWALSVRLCSKADQRSPKPFVSKQAIAARKGRHFDPYQTIEELLLQLGDLYGDNRSGRVDNIIVADLTAGAEALRQLGKHTHVITSPPYINAQDYFRNFKLELYVLEGVMPYKVANLRCNFIGTERGDLLQPLSPAALSRNCRWVPDLHKIEEQDRRLAAVVHRYFFDMDLAFESIQSCLAQQSTLVLVCGDNLVAGVRIRTWNILKGILESKGFVLVDMFADKIQDRLLAPKRSGHKGIIKEEVVCTFERR